MKKIAYVAVSCLLLSGCEQAPQGYNQGPPQQQGYYPNQQAQNAYPQQQMAPAPAPVATPAPAPQQAAAPSRPSHVRAKWKGKWFGVEGMYINITPTSPGNYDIEMQYDSENLVRVNGIDRDGVIAFQRNGDGYTLRPSNGDQIGLKWLDGEKNCLMVQDGEGYCRR